MTTSRTTPKRTTCNERPGEPANESDDLDAAREAVLARIPEGSSVMTNASVTLAEAGLVDAINGDLDAEPVLLQRRDGRLERMLIRQPGETVSGGSRAHCGSSLPGIAPGKRGFPESWLTG